MDLGVKGQKLANRIKARYSHGRASCCNMTTPTTSTTSKSPQIRRGEISLIMATRARPESLAEVFTSLKANTAQKDKLSIWLYVDEDDQVTRQAIDKGTFPDPGFPVHWHIGPQTAGLCETQHALWHDSGHTSEMYMITCDDARFDTPGWDNIVREKLSPYPDGVYIGAPFDPATADTSTYPIFGWQWLETLKKMFPGYFPYWFDDRWAHEVADMAGRWVPIPIILFPIRGKGRTRRMRDLPFWSRFFQLTIEERKESAKKLLDVVRFENESARAETLKKLEQRAAELAGVQDKFSDLYCVFQEERFTMHTPEERRAFDAGYLKQEAIAVGRLIQFAQSHIAAERHEEALKFLDATFMSNLRVRQAQDLKAECLRALGRNGEAEKLTGETLAAWPEMSFWRRSFRFLGMVASDGKTMLVGLRHKGDRKKG